MDVVETGGSPSDRALDVAELPLLEVVHGLCKIVGSEVKERQKRRPQSLRAVVHDRSGEGGGGWIHNVTVYCRYMLLLCISKVLHIWLKYA